MGQSTSTAIVAEQPTLPASTEEKNSIDILTATLDRDGFVLERADLKTRWPKHMDEFTCLDESTGQIRVCLTHDGRIRPVNEDDNGVLQSILQMVEQKVHSKYLPDRPRVHEALQAGHQVLDLQVPGTNLSEQLTFVSGEKLLLRVFSEDTPAAEPLVRRCSAEEVVEHVLGVLQTGADSVNLVLGYEMLQLHFDKMDVVEEADHRVRPWIITHYAWGPVRHFRLWPEPDSLQKYFDIMADANRNAYEVQQKILRELRRSGHTHEEVERFLDSTGGDGSDHGLMDAKTDQLLRMMAKKATTQGFWIQETDESFHPLDGNLPREGKSGRMAPPTPPHRVKTDTVEHTMKALVKQLGVLAGDIQKWQLLIDWEPRFAKTMKESLHEAQRLRMMGDESGHVRMALKTVELMEKMTPSQRLGTAKLNNTEWYAVVMANKQIADEMFETFQQGGMPRDRFEKLLEQHCKRVIRMVEGTLLPMAEHNRDLERQVMCLRQKADYLRYMYFWLPGARQHEDEIVQTYRRAAEMANGLHPRHVIGSSVFVNLACFYAECKRDNDMAISVCKDGKVWGTRHSDRVPTAGEIFGFTLLERNLEALESQLALLELSFDEDELELHKEALGSAWKEEEKKEPISLPEEPEVKVLDESIFDRGEDCFADWGSHAKLLATFAGKTGICSDRKQPDSPAANLEDSTGSSPPKGLQEWASSLARSVGLPQLSTEQQKECKAVLRWLSGMPCHQHVVDADGGEGADPIMQMRWVNAVEMPSNGMARSTRRTARGPSEKVFLVACVVRLNTKSRDAGERRGRGRLRTSSLGDTGSWSPSLVDMLAKWPKRGASEKTLKIDKSEVCAELGLLLTDDGVVKRPFTLELDHLDAGDTLQMLGDLEGQSCWEGVRMLREKRLKVPVTLTFIPSMKVKNAYLEADDRPIVAKTDYCERHTNFVGWRDSHNNLRPSPNFTSLADLVEDIRESKLRTKDLRLPKRIPGFSARCAPVLAMNRGCK